MHTRAFKNLFSGRPGRRRGRKSATRFSVEQLEPRTLLSVLFTDNFNTDTGGSSGNGNGTIGGSGGPSFYTYRDVSLVPNAGPAGTGDTAVQIQYHQPDESSYPGLGMNLGTNFNNLSEYYVQFYAKVDSNIIGGMKYIKFFGSQGVPASGNSANTTFGIEYANDRMTYVNYGNGSTTTNDAQVSTTYAGTTTPGMEPNIQYTADAGGSINIADGNWHLVQVHVKHDTSFAASDGALDVWVDGVHVLGVTGLTNRNDQNSTVWNNVEWGNYTDTTLYDQGNNGPFSLYVDDVTISTTQITGTPPAAPKSLTANPGNNQIALNWTGSSGAYSYNVFRGTSSGGEGSIPVAFGVTGTSWTDTTAANGTKYYYEVRAVNTGGESGSSNEVSATAGASIPGSVTLAETAGTGVTVTPVDDTYVPGAWGTSGSEQVYGDATSFGSPGLVAYKNLSTYVPAGSTITSATLTLVESAYDSGTITIDRATTNWTTLAAGASEDNVDGRYSNIANSTFWAAGSGTDFSAADYTTAGEVSGTATQFGVGKTITLNVTAIVQSWSTSGNNYGFVVRGGNFESSENTAGYAGPTLTINYTHSADVQLGPMLGANATSDNVYLAANSSSVTVEGNQTGTTFANVAPSPTQPTQKNSPHSNASGTSTRNPISNRWRQLGSAGIINFSDSAYLLGLVNSDDASALSNATLVSVALTPSLPTDWSDRNLDTVMAGWTADSSGAFTVSGTGSDMGGTFNQFILASDSVTGDPTIHAEITN